VVLINAAWGLGENVVQGTVDPDEFEVYKPYLSDESLVPIVKKKRGGKAQKMIYARNGERTTKNVPTSHKERTSFVLDDPEILTLARWASLIEAHYGQPMDMEWAKDGETGKLFIVQARPETVQSRRDASIFKTYRIKTKGKTLVSGLSIGDAVVAGRVCVIESARDIARFVDGAILVTRTTDPDWVPIMKRAAAIVTDHGGRTSHAAIVSRELGLPAVVGTGDATQVLHGEQEVTVSCAEGDEGFIYEGTAEFDSTELRLDDIPPTRTKIMLNLANPAAAFRWWRLPSDGVGLARMEFVVSNHIKIHPMALVRFAELKDENAKGTIAALTEGYDDKTEYFIDLLSRGLAQIAAAHAPIRSLCA
jgi:pyruvate,water dikinase